MSLAAGTRLGPYEIIALLGAGGMGEVYRARDLRLDRTVALKVLPDRIAADADRLARFEREAKTLAALNHPHIAQVYGFEDVPSAIPGVANTRALVMELVEGTDLVDRIARGPLPFDEALPIARQIAEALEAAHGRGIVHRDLKPANIRINADGGLKVLDFGLAKTFDAPALSLDTTVTLTNAPPLTEAGTILGTVAYMSPEQARGKLVDHRTDIWAFGCILYELLSGRRAFAGATASDVLAKLIEREPDWDLLPRTTPAPVRAMLRQCLHKDPAKRFHHVADARLDLEEALLDRARDPTGSPRATAGVGRRWRDALLFGAIGAALAAGIRLAITSGSHAPAGAPVLRFTLPLPPDTAFSGGPAVSPDGRFVAQALIDQTGVSRIWLRPLDAHAFQPLNGTDGGSAPFWAPDGSELGFIGAGKLRRIPRQGGAPIDVTTLPVAFASAGTGAWGADGTILVGGISAGIVRVHARGGPATAATTLDAAAGQTEHRYPRWLPGGRRFMYLALSRGDARGVFVESLSGGTRERMMDAANVPQFASGAILQAGMSAAQNRVTVLTAQAFDAGSRIATGQSVVLASDVNAAFSTSDSGVVVYRRSQASNHRFVWVDATGGADDPVLAVSGQGAFNLSRDNRLIAFAEDGRLVVHDLARGVTSPVTETGGFAEPILSPDGRRLVYSRVSQSAPGIAVRPTAGGPEEIVVPSKGPIYAEDWSSDGRYLSVHENTAGRSRGLIVPLQGDRTVKVFADLPEGSSVDEHRFSPDGRWLAYNATEAGRPDVYVVPLPPTGERWKVSVAGGAQPRWRSDGTGLFYLAPSGDLMTVDLTNPRRGAPEIGRPRTLFRTGLVVAANMDQYAPSANGKRFLLRRPVDADSRPQLYVIVNWPSLLK